MNQVSVNQPQAGAIYARLSRNRHGLSTNCAIQEAECRDYAADQGVEIVASFEDDDISASKFSTKPRPGLDRLLKLVEDNRVNVIYVTELSRLYRRMEELLVLINVSERTALKRIETTDGEVYHLDTAEGRHQARGAVNNNIRESDVASRRQKRKKAAQAALGKDSGGERPYGYEPDRVTVRESEGAVIREMVRRYLNGHSTTQIAYWANDEGHRMARGGQWGSINVRNLMKSRRIGGIRVHLGAEYPAVWEPIIDKQAFERLQLEIQLRAQHPSAVPKARKYLLTGLVYCAKCGKPMAGNIRRDNPSKPKKRYYVCRMHGNHTRTWGCGRTRRYAVPLEHFVREAVLYRLDSKAMAELLSQSRDDGELKALLTQQSSLKQRKQLISTQYGNGELDPADYAVASQANEKALQDVQQALQGAQQSLTGIDIDPGKTLREAYENEASDEWRRRLLSLIIERIDLLPGRDNPPYDADGVRCRFEPARVDIRWRI